jgi:hypothetical protein
VLGIRAVYGTALKLGISSPDLTPTPQMNAFTDGGFRNQLQIARNQMTLCPIALAASCNKCPAVTLCPLKSVLGDYEKPAETKPEPEKVSDTK